MFKPNHFCIFLRNVMYIHCSKYLKEHMNFSIHDSAMHLHFRTHLLWPDKDAAFPINLPFLKKFDVTDSKSFYPISVLP